MYITISVLSTIDKPCTSLPENSPDLNDLENWSLSKSVVIWNNCSLVSCPTLQVTCPGRGAIWFVEHWRYILQSSQGQYVNWLLNKNNWVQMFYFNSNTTVPLQCAALVLCDSICWQDVVWLTVRWDANKFPFRRL